jgi:ribosomal protein L37AE/L43A
VLTRAEFDRRRAALILVARLACPHCRAALNDMSERVASATGRCDACGGQILDAGDRPA